MLFLLFYNLLYKISKNMVYTMPITQRLKKLVKSLHQKVFREQNGLFIAEGEKLAVELVKSNYQVELIIIRESPTAEVQDVVIHYSDRGIPIFSAPKHIFDQLTNTKTPQTIICIVNIKEQNLIPDEPFIALDGISDPGNVGTIIRTAEWFGYKQVILGRDSADIYNPKTVRSTMGSIFRMNIIYEPNLAYFIKETFPTHKIFAADVNSKNLIETIKLPKKYGIVLGSESHGISEQVKSIIDKDFKIEGFGSAESLNVAVSAGICFYNFRKK